MDDIDEQEKLRRLMDYIGRNGSLPDDLDMTGTGEADAEEKKFQSTIRSLPWFNDFKSKYGEEPNLDNPSDYDYRSAVKSGVKPGKDFHWDSAYKGLDNPRRILDVGDDVIDTKFGVPATEEERLLRRPSLFKRHFGDK